MITIDREKWADCINELVRHRIDGLEIKSKNPPRWWVVRHRIDGLENQGLYAR